MTVCCFTVGCHCFPKYILHALEEALVEGGIPNVEVKFALVVAMETTTSLPTTWWAIWITISESVGLILPGIMELPRLRAAA